MVGMYAGFQQVHHFSRTWRILGRFNGSWNSNSEDGIRVLEDAVKLLEESDGYAWPHLFGEVRDNEFDCTLPYIFAIPSTHFLFLR